MIGELGHVALILALQLALIQSGLCLLGAARADAGWMAAGRRAGLAQAGFTLCALLALAWSFLVNDFSLLNVAEHSSRALPAIYRLTATWGSHEGSMLLWVCLLGGWTVAVHWMSRGRPDDFVARVIGVMGFVSAGFLAFLLFVSNPFLRLDPPAPEGLDLNPLLQDPGMVVHPPLLYMGYVGFAVAFSFSVAVLLSRGTPGQWVAWARPWTLVAWAFLTGGILLGSWWAYYELGWGGWWFWDPTENASLMPWLVGTALLHCLIVSERRGALGGLTQLLAILAFSLCLVGTFLVRSGVLSSVHAFAQDPARGLFILVFLSAVIGGSLWLLARQAPRTQALAPIAPISRDATMLAGASLLLVATATVMLGTLYPLLLDALGLGKVSVGPPYFNAVFVPIMLPVLVLSGMASHLGWTGAPSPRRGAALALICAVSVAAGLALAAAWGDLRWPAALGASVALWIALATLHSSTRGDGWAARRIGMTLAHLGLAAGVAGIGFVSAHQSETAVVMKPGDTVRMAQYTVAFNGIVEEAGPNYSAVRAGLGLSSGERRLGTLEPERRVYHASRTTMTETALHHGLNGDLYVALGEARTDGSAVVRLFHKPMIWLLWLGGLLMALGSLTSVLTRRAGRHRP